MKKVFVICGSTRKDSTNHRYIEAVKNRLGRNIAVSELKSLMTIPHFNPDDDNDTVGNPVKFFRQQLSLANGIIISTPEYAMGIPGALKNAIDWTVSSSSFSKKPVLLITASSLGEKAHRALIDVLEVIEADVSDTNVLIPFAKAKIDNDNNITDGATISSIDKVLNVFINKL